MRALSAIVSSVRTPYTTPCIRPNSRVVEQSKRIGSTRAIACCLLGVHAVHHNLRSVARIDRVRKCRLDWNRTRTGVSSSSPGCARHAPHPVAHQPRRYTPVTHHFGHPPLSLGTEFARRVWARTTGAANRFFGVSKQPANHSVAHLVEVGDGDLPGALLMPTHSIVGVNNRPINQLVAHLVEVGDGDLPGARRKVHVVAVVHLGQVVEGAGLRRGRKQCLEHR